MYYTRDNTIGVQGVGGRVLAIRWKFWCRWVGVTEAAGGEQKLQLNYGMVFGWNDFKLAGVLSLGVRTTATMQDLMQTNGFWGLQLSATWGCPSAEAWGGSWGRWLVAIRLRGV